MKSTIYADHAATTPLSTAALSAMEPFLTTEFYNPSTKYSTAIKAHKAIEKARVCIAECIGAEPSEIYFTSGGTESDNWAIKGTMLPQKRSHGIISSEVEHHAVLNSCSFMERIGYTATYLKPDASGVIAASTLKQAISSESALVTIMLVNNELGTIEPIDELADIAHFYDAIFHTDAVQAVGHIPVDVNALGVDMLSASAHKFGGPKGIGFLFIRNGTHLEELLSGGGQERGRRAGTENVAGIVGMAAALEFSCNHMSETTNRLQRNRKAFQQALSQTNLNYCINGGCDVSPGIISLSLRDYEGEMLLHRLDLMGIQVATGSACDSQSTHVSHVLKAINLPLEYAKGTIRVSLGQSNTVDDATKIARAIEKICSR